MHVSASAVPDEVIEVAGHATPGSNEVALSLGGNRAPPMTRAAGWPSGDAFASATLWSMNSAVAGCRGLAERARFATVSREPTGWPFASLVAVAFEPAGRPLFLLSTLAEHTKKEPCSVRPLADFAMWRLEVKSVRWVGGFGRMEWVTGEAYAGRAGAS